MFYVKGIIIFMDFLQRIHKYIHAYTFICEGCIYVYIYIIYIFMCVMVLTTLMCMMNIKKFMLN